jgi:exodeoxyribonuclease III
LNFSDHVTYLQLTAQASPDASPPPKPGMPRRNCRSPLPAGRKKRQSRPDPTPDPGAFYLDAAQSDLTVCALRFKRAIMSGLKIVSWNINSVRLRAPNVAAFVEAEAPDVVCLQETKCRDGEFPVKAFEAMGLKHLALNGQGGGHHGVAIASRLPIERIEGPDLCREGHSRVIAVRVGGVEVHNIYLPAGGDEPDPDTNPKFSHKLDFLERLGEAYAGMERADGRPRILVGDLNVAPQEHDVWSHKQLLKIVSHTPAETERLEASRKAAGFADLARIAHPAEQKLYTWWSYRARDWAASNRGRRLDHIWANDSAMGGLDPADFRIHLAWRGGEKPSDHAPISVLASA